MGREMNFNALVESIQEAFIKVNDMSEAQHVNKLQEYFEEDGTPKTFDMQYPYFDENGVPAYRFASIPQICLVPVSSLKLDEVEVDFKVQIYGKVPLKERESGDDEDQDASPEKGEKKTVLGYIPQKKLLKGREDSYAHIRLKFVSQDAPEGLMRIKDQFTSVTI